MRSHRSFVAVAGALAAVVVGLAVPAGAGSDRPPAQVMPSSAASKPPIDPAVAFVAGERGISVAEAEARLRAQDQVVERLEASGATEDPGYGGAWADDQDRIVVAATSAAALARIRSKIGPTATAASSTAIVATSLADLEARSAAVTRKVAALPTAERRAISTVIDVRANEVRLSLPADRPASAAQRSLRSVVQADGVAVDAKGVETEDYACNASLFCDPPLRGGTRALKSPNYCTLAFLAQGTEDDDYYMLTAAHCGQTGSWYSFFPDGSSHTIGNTIRSEKNQYGDFQAVKINNPLGWAPRAWVVVLASNTSGIPTTTDYEYPIASESMSTVGTAVCKTGVTTGTTCGWISQTGYTTSSGVGNLAVVEGMDADHGDSGAPIYKLNKAYGILHGGASGLGVLYSGINTAEARLDVEVLNESP